MPPDAGSDEAKGSALIRLPFEARLFLLSPSVVQCSLDECECDHLVRYAQRQIEAHDADGLISIRIRRDPCLEQLDELADVGGIVKSPTEETIRPTAVASDPFASGVVDMTQVSHEVGGHVQVDVGVDS